MNEERRLAGDARVSWRMLGAAFAGAFVFLYLRTFLLRGTPFVAADDQDLFFARAIRILHGQVPYRDFFEIVTPGTELLYAAAFRVLGVHAWVIDAWAIAVGTGFCVALTRMAQRLFCGPTVLLPAALFLVMDFNSGLDLTHQWYSTLAALCAAGVLMGGSNLRRLFATSTLCAAATLFTQTKGVFVFVALSVYLVWVEPAKDAGARRRIERLAVFVLPYLAIVLGVLGYYVAKAGLHPLWFDLVTFPEKYMSTAEVNRPITYLHQLHQLPQIVRAHRAVDTVQIVPIVFIYLLVPFAYVVGGCLLWRKRTEMAGSVWRQLVLIHLVGVALFLAIAPGPRHFRLCTVAPPAVLIYVWLVDRSGRRTLLLSLSWIIAAGFGLLLPLHRQMGWHAVLDLPIGRTAFSDRQLYDEFQWAARQSHRGEMAFNHAALGLYLSLENPTATEFVNYDETTRPEQAAALLKAIARRPPQFIVLEPARGAVSSVDHAAPFREYVYAHYRLAKVFPLNHSASKEEIWVFDALVEDRMGY